MRLAQIVSVVLIALLVAQSPARADGGLVTVAAIFSALAVAQLLEGTIITLVALRKLGRNGIVVMVFFCIAIWATWLFVLSPGGFDRTLDGLVAATRMSTDAAGAIIDVSFWLLMLLAGPVIAALAGLIMRRVRHA